MRLPTIAPVLTALAPLTVLALLAGCRTTVRVERLLEVDVPLTVAGPVPLDIETRNGRVTVEVDAGSDQLRITADCRAGGSTYEMAEERAAAFDVRVSVLPDGTHRVRPEPAGAWRSGDAVSLRVVVPSAGAVWIHTSNGRVSVADAQGDCSLSTSNGAVHAARTTGLLDIDTSNGPVKVEDHVGPIEARSSNGSITIALADGSDSPFDVSTSNGNIRVEMGPDWSGHVEGSTSNGSLRHREHGELVLKTKHALDVQRGSNDEVSTARTSNGSVTIEVR